ncbi:MAG: sensor histidine kinase [Anaerolineales bacterium]
MKQRLQAVNEARRIFLILLGVRALLYILGAVGLSMVGAITYSGALYQLGGLVVLSLLAILPLPPRLRQWWLGVLLLADMFIMSIHVAPVATAIGRTSQGWVAEATQLAVIEPFMFMVIPLVLMAWAYGRRGAVLGTVWGASLQLASTVVSMGKAKATGWDLATALGRAALMLTLSLIVAVLAERQRNQIAALEEAQVRLRNHADMVEQLAVSRERNRMARDLHDTLAHSLSALTVQLQALRGVQERDPQAAKNLVDEALAVARSGLQESRNAIQALRTDPLTMLGLIGAIRGELRSLEARTGMQAELTVSGETMDLGANEELTAWRICEEALRNVEKHATARHVIVRLAYGMDQFELSVADDGQGFDSSIEAVGHYGLEGMRERAELVGGLLEIQSAPGRGTTVRLTIQRGST